MRCRGFRTRATGLAAPSPDVAALMPFHSIGMFQRMLKMREWEKWIPSMEKGTGHLLGPKAVIGDVVDSVE